MLVNRVHKPHKSFSCRICGNAVEIKVCKCQKAYYCSKNCQKIDWKSHKSDCYKIIEHPKSTKQFASNGSIATSSDKSQQMLHQYQQQSFAPSHQNELAREGRQYDPTPLQYQQPLPLSTNTSAPSTTIEDFEENLFNSLMNSAGESSEREILENLNITDELLKSYNLDTDSSSSFDDQNQKNEQYSAGEDQSFDEKILAQIERHQSFECQPEYKETLDKLEKELSLFREINLHEPQHQLEGEDSNSSSDMTQISSNQNPKYINHAKLDDHLLYK
jgi:endogenous inhibitor of DNA gyrase (YacG/DUF329 family)